MIEQQRSCSTSSDQGMLCSIRCFCVNSAGCLVSVLHHTA